MTNNPQDLTELALSQITAGLTADWSTLSNLYADDVDYRDPDAVLAGRAAVLAHLQELAGALPGCAQRIRRTYVDGADGVLVEWTLTGSGPTGPIELDIATAYQFRQERIASEHNYWDNASLLAQLGLAPTTAGGQ